jgi:hypothetical protein
LLRLLLLPTAVSDDVSRYLFEGKLVRAGINPYAQTADSESIAEYRDGQWAMMNNREKPTVYPPLAQLIFAAIGAIAYQPLAYKLTFVLADLLTLGAVIKLLKRRGLSLAFSGFYALNPVVLMSFAGEAHFDSLMIAALMWALYLYETGRLNGATAGVSIAAGIKWIMLPLIPFFGRKRPVSGALIALITLLIPATLFFDSIHLLLQGLFAFGGSLNFNGMVYDCLLYGADLPRSVCNGVALTVFALVILWRWLWKERAPLDSHLRWILGTFIAVVPTVHFWYFTWIVPLVCLRPSLPCLTFSVTAGSYFFVWINAAEDLIWKLDLWQQWIFWGPFALACGYEIWSTRGRVLWPWVRPVESRAPGVAVIIPTLNAAASLTDALESIRQQTVEVSEVVVVDAGSTDATLQLLADSSLPVKILSGERGRGIQIAAGIEAATADWVVVLHADAVLARDAVECILRAVSSDHTIIGGALGQRFKGKTLKLLPIELLNDLRLLFTRTAFGDQIQFFHRGTALHCKLVPKQALMEDVESSWRTREHGGFAFLNQPCQVNQSKWDRSKWFKRFCLVMRLISKYRWARIRGKRRAEKLSEQLYRDYYSN